MSRSHLGLWPKLILKQLLTNLPESRFMNDIKIAVQSVSQDFPLAAIILLIGHVAHATSLYV
jgi:hypothetical protein